MTIPLFTSGTLPDFLDTSQAAHRLCVTPRVLIEWHRCGFGPTRHSDEDGIFYLRSELEEWEECGDPSWLDLKRCYLFSDVDRRVLVRITAAKAEALPRVWNDRLERDDVRLTDVRDALGTLVPMRFRRKNTAQGNDDE